MKIDRRQPSGNAEKHGLLHVDQHPLRDRSRNARGDDGSRRRTAIGPTSAITRGDVLAGAVQDMEWRLA